MVKIVSMKVGIFIIFVTMLFTSCNTDNKETSPEEDHTENINEVEEEKAEEDAEESEVDISLFDRALLEKSKFNWPDSYKMISVEDSNDVITNITVHQKGYSKRLKQVFLTYLILSVTMMKSIERHLKLKQVQNIELHLEVLVGTQLPIHLKYLMIL